MIDGNPIIIFPQTDETVIIICKLFIGIRIKFYSYFVGDQNYFYFKLHKHIETYVIF